MANNSDNTPQGNKPWNWKGLRSKIGAKRAEFKHAYSSWQFHRSRRSDILPIILIAVTIFAAIGFVVWFPHTSFASWHLSNSSAIGDAIGGLTSPIIGVLNAVLLWWTLRVQNRQFVQQNNRSDLDRRIDKLENLIENLRFSYTNFEGKRFEYRGAAAIESAKDHLNYDVTFWLIYVDELEWATFLRGIRDIYRSVKSGVELATGVSDSKYKTQQSVYEVTTFFTDVAAFGNVYIDRTNELRTIGSDFNIDKYFNLMTKFTIESWADDIEKVASKYI